MKEVGEFLMAENRRTKNIITGLLIGLCFLWTSCGYLSWLYRLLDFYQESTVTLLTEVLGYLLQALGLLFFSLYIKKKVLIPEAHQLSLRTYFCIVSGTAFLCLCAGLFCSLPALCLLFGFLFNILVGVLFGFYLSYLAYLVEWKHRGLTFGLGYGVSCILTWLLSMVEPGNFLENKAALLIYGLIAIGSVGILFLPLPKPEDEVSFGKQTLDHILCNEREYPKHFLIYVFLFVFLISMLRSIGFCFPCADLSAGISLEFVRAFYAIGLITAGILNDKKRSIGAISCICALIFPFLMVALKSTLKVSLLLWIISYIFYGFYSVYRVILYTDLATTKRSLLYLAPFGLLAGRLGESVGNYAGLWFISHPLPMITVSSVLFCVCVLVFFHLYHNLYFDAKNSSRTLDERKEEFILKYQLSPREQNVFHLILDGMSNDEIAANLYISENTVKFHIRNILKKTQCSNRSELIQQVRTQ